MLIRQGARQRCSTPKGQIRFHLLRYRLRSDATASNSRVSLVGSVDPNVRNPTRTAGPGRLAPTAAADPKATFALQDGAGGASLSDDRRRRRPARRSVLLIAAILALLRDGPSLEEHPGRARYLIEG